MPIVLITRLVLLFLFKNSTMITQIKKGNKIQNPKGKVTLVVASYNKPDGTVDNIEHWYAILVEVNVQGTPAPPPFPPPPPRNNVNVEYDIGGGWNQFTGSPSSNPGIFNQTVNVPNGDTLFVRVS